jgi:hypothetical protein
MQTAINIEQILETIKKKYPLVALRINPEKVREYVLQKDPTWEEKRKNLPPKKTKPKPEPKEESALETEVKEEIKKLPSWKPEAEFGRDEKEKLDMLHGHRVILFELWNNYMKIREGRQDTQKKGYLGSIAREIDAIQKLESAERDLMSALEEVRRAEEAEAARRAEQKRIADEKLALAARMEEAGMKEQAAAVLDAPIASVAVAEPVKVEKPEGQSIIENWQARVVDADAVPRVFCSPDAVKLGRYAKLMKGKASVEGIVFEDVGTVRRRTA